MPIGVLTRVVIFDASLYAPGGMVNRWVHTLGRRFAANSRDGIHSRTGNLKKGVRAGYRKRGTKRIEATIGSTAPYTMAVLRGTDSPIMSRAAWAAGGPQYHMIQLPTGKYLPVPVKGHMMALGRNLYGPERPIGIVSGQGANNFFYTGWVKTAARHPALGRVPFPAVLQ